MRSLHDVHYVLHVAHTLAFSLSLSLSLSHTLTHTHTHAGGPQKKRRLLCSCALLADSSVRSWRGPSHGRCVATPPHTPCLSLTLSLCLDAYFTHANTWMRTHTFSFSLPRAHTHTGKSAAGSPWRAARRHWHRHSWSVLVLVNTYIN
jgi:hypothetical protein